MTGTLHDRAAALGVATSYHDIAGTLHHADDAVIEIVVGILEADRTAAQSTRRLTPALHHASDGSIPVDAVVEHATIDIGEGPMRMSIVRNGEQDSIQLPSELPHGCHVVEFTTDRGPGDTILVVAPPSMPRNAALAGRSALFAPTYALWERDDPLPSFAHLHRLARDLKRSGVDVVSTLPLYASFLDDPFDPSPYSPVSRLHWNELYLDDADLPDLPIPEQGETIDWRRLAERRRRQLMEATRRLDAAGRDQLTAFTTAHPDVGAYARFRAGREAGGDLQVEESYVLAQYLADRQLQAIHDDDRAAALALDLPIGSHPDGYETWADPTMFATGVTVGAPPDAFFAEGQSWGFPPPLPAAMTASGQRTWRQLIARVGRHADVLRIDHAMAVERLWWVPDGCSPAQGVYVHYPREEIVAVIAASAAAADLTIVGEDLGTVPTAVAEVFERWDLLGMYEEQFHLDADPLPHIPPRTVAGIRTHDMDPIAEVVAARDTSGYRARLGAAHQCAIDARWDEVLDQMLLRLTKSEAYLVMIDLDDLIGETRPHNLPGRVVPGLWSRRLPQPLSEILSDPEVARRLDILRRDTA
ncbi:MAG: 4-alpha-glucanotransferase [Ilumatobacteraceae bacterium]